MEHWRQHPNATPRVFFQLLKCFKGILRLIVDMDGKGMCYGLFFAESVAARGIIGWFSGHPLPVQVGHGWYFIPNRA